MALFPFDIAIRVPEMDADQRQRLRVVAAILPIVASATIFLFVQQTSPEVLHNIGFYPDVLIIIEIALLLISALVVIFWYLQTGFKKEDELELRQRHSDDFLDRVRREQERVASHDSKRLDFLETGVRDALSQISLLKNEVTRSTSPDINQIVESLSERVQAEAPDQIIRNIELRLAESVTTDSKLENVRDISEDGRRRIYVEINSLMRRGNINLALGGVTTILGLLILGYFIFTNTANHNNLTAFALYYIPKVTLIVFIQAFAYFFLKLYKSSLEEIKFFQNEMTNMEQKFIALTAAVEFAESSTLDSVIESFSLTERNPPRRPMTKQEFDREKSLLQLGVEAAKTVATASTAKS